jgi:hypothetical protein
VYDNGASPIEVIEDAPNASYARHLSILGRIFVILSEAKDLGYGASGRDPSLRSG